MIIGLNVILLLNLVVHGRYAISEISVKKCDSYCIVLSRTLSLENFVPRKYDGT